MKSLIFYIAFFSLINIINIFFNIVKVESRVTPIYTPTNNVEKEKHLNSNGNSDQAFLEETGRKMSSFMDLDINPCDDFYEYACGNWDTILKHSKYEESITPLMHTYYNLRFKVQKLLTAPIDSKESFKKFKKRLEKAQKYYQSCINVDLFSKQKVPVYMEFINTMGGFPAVNANWKSDNFNWTKMLAHVNIFDCNAIFNTRILDQFPFMPKLNSDRKFYAPLPMTYSDLVNNRSVIHMRNRSLMEYYLKMYGAKINEIDKIISDIMNFGRNLLNLMEGMKFQMEIMEPITYLIENIPEFDWKTYFRIYIGQQHYNDSLSVFIVNPYLFSNLPRIIEETGSDVIANYLALNFLHTIHFENSFPKFHDELCVTKVMQDMSFGLGEIYLEEYWDKIIQSELNDMFNQMKISFKNLIMSSDWMEEIAKNDSINKVENQIAHIGHIKDPIIKSLINVTDNIFISNNFYANNINGKLARHKMNLVHYLDKDITNNTHPAKVLNPLIINASYNPKKNSIQIYAADFQVPLYDERYPKSLKYGAIGQVFGHEMSHAFDEIGVKTNITAIRWSDNDIANYIDRCICFVDQYSNIYYPEVNLTTNGAITLNENIADNGGIKIAYMAYMEYIKNSGLSESELMAKETMPFVNLNYKQTFFLAHAQKYCSTYYRKHFLENENSKYATSMLRINVPLQNYIEFAKEFNCPVNSNMNIIKKCAMF